MTLVGAAVAAAFNASSKTMITIEYFIRPLYQTKSQDVGVFISVFVVSTISEWFRVSGE
jgi:hypothetical protein